MTQGQDGKDKLEVSRGAGRQELGAVQAGARACAQTLGTEGNMACSRNSRKARVRETMTGTEA